MPRRMHVGMLLDPRKISVDAPPAPPKTYHLETTNDPPYSANLNHEFAASYTDCWARFKLISNHVNLRSDIVLAFTEWITAQNNPPFPNHFPWGITVAEPNQGFSTVWLCGNYNASVHATIAQVSGHYAIGDGVIVDLRARYDGVINYYSDHPLDRWHSEVWVNDTFVSSSDLDLENSTSSPIWTSIKGIAIPNHYGDSGISKIDDISAGTTRGASDIMSPITFNDQTYGPLIPYDNLLGGGSGIGGPYKIVED